MAASRAATFVSSSGSASCGASASSRFVSERPSKRHALALDRRHRPREQLAGRGENRARVARWRAQRLRARGAREVVEAQAQDHRSADALRRAQAAADPVDERDQRRVQRLGRLRAAAAHRPLATDRAPAHAGRHPPRVAVVRQGVQLTARALPDEPDQRRLRELRHLPDRRDPARVQLARGDLADAPQRLDRQRMQERELASGGTTSSPSGFATPDATLARNFVRATPTVIGSPTFSRTRDTQTSRDLRRRARDPPHSAHVDERLVDRQPLHQRRRVLEDREHVLAGLRVGLEARRHDDGLRAQALGRPAAHRGLDPEGLRLVGRGQDHPAPDDHRLAQQPRVVALLDGREERVEVGVENRSVRHVTNICSHDAGRNEIQLRSEDQARHRARPPRLEGHDERQRGDRRTEDLERRLAAPTRSRACPRGSPAPRSRSRRRCRRPTSPRHGARAGSPPTGRASHPRTRRRSRRRRPPRRSSRAARRQTRPRTISTMPAASASEP